MNALPLRAAAGYGVLGLPLAMAALPLYVHVPKFYGDTLGVPLATVGGVLLAVRVLDALQDPLLGAWSDRVRDRKGTRWPLVGLGAGVLAAGLLALFMPPHGSASQAAWLAGSLVVASFGYSLASVAYQAIGAEVTFDPGERTRLAAWREGFGLAGVLVAATLPEALRSGLGERPGYAAMALAFAPLVLGAAGVGARLSPPLPPRLPAPRTSGLRLALRNTAFRRLALVFVLNGIAAAIPATLFLFFVDDVLAAPSWSAAFLAAYFASGALGLPAWVALARRWGRERAWAAAMALALLAFAGAFALGPGDVAAFMAICVLSGLAVGADLALPAALLADAIDRDVVAGEAGAPGAYFGLWTLLTKANLALAAGLALPLVAAAGYQPHAAVPAGLHALSAMYGLAPCVLKASALAVLVLWRPR